MDILTSGISPDPEIRLTASKKLVGIKKTMSLAENKTPELWKSFMLRKKEIKNNINSFLFSLQIYPIPDFSTFTPQTSFIKWAAIEVPDFSDIPEGMNSLVLPEGLYAVFLYKGKSEDFALAFRHIFFEWFSNSDYLPDNCRPHFELLGEKYKNNHPDSEEEIWIPVKSILL